MGGLRCIAFASVLGVLSGCTPIKGAPRECAVVERPDAYRTGPVPGARPHSVAALPPLVPRDAEDGVPAFHLYVTNTLPDEDGYRPGWLVDAGRCHAVGLKERGETSRVHPKTSYTLEFEPGTLPRLDAPSAEGDLRRKLVLAASFNDNSYLRQRLAWALWNLMAPEHLQVNAYNAVVYVNDEYQGLYTVIDHVNDELLMMQGLSRSTELFKAASQDANFSRVRELGGQKRTLEEGFERKGNPAYPDEAYDHLVEFVRFVADSDPATFAARHGEHFVARSYVDWWVYVMLLLGADNYAKNAYHLRAAGPEGRFVYVPWDVDSTFGQTWRTYRLPYDDLRDFRSLNLLFARMLEDPVLSEQLQLRMQEVLEGPLEEAVVLGLLDAFAEEISAAARRDEARWGEEYRSFVAWRDRTDFNSHEEEVGWIRAWISARWRLLGG